MYIKMYGEFSFFIVEKNTSTDCADYTDCKFLYNLWTIKRYK
jgi:hypothetical protein